MYICISLIFQASHNWHIILFQIKFILKWNSGSLIHFVYWSPHCEDMKGSHLINLYIFTLISALLESKSPKDLFSVYWQIPLDLCINPLRRFEACKWCKTSPVKQQRTGEISFPVYFYRIAQSLPVTTQIVTLICSSRVLQSLHCYTGCCVVHLFLQDAFIHSNLRINLLVGKFDVLSSTSPWLFLFSPERSGALRH